MTKPINGSTEAYKSGRKRHRRRREARAKILKSHWLQSNGPCKTCGSWDRLEIDHITPLNKKHKNLHIFLRSPEYQYRELALCQTLCWSCHRIKSALERRKYNHGLNLYERHGCRCQTCRNAHAAKRRRNRHSQHNRGIPWSCIN